MTVEQALIKLISERIAPLEARIEALENSEPDHREIIVSTANELQDALQQLQPAQTIMLEPGLYADRFTFPDGQPGKQYTIKSIKPLEAVIGGPVSLGSHSIIDGLRFAPIGDDDFGVAAKGKANWQVLGCEFQNARGLRVAKSQHFQIQWCTFSGSPKASGGHTQSQLFIWVHSRDADTNQLISNGRVHRCYFHDEYVQGDNTESHSFGIGNYDPAPYHDKQNVITASECFFDTYRRRPLYSKVSGFKQIQCRTIARRGIGGIRNGHRCALISNQWDGVHQVLIDGPDHKIYGNVLTGGGHYSAHARYENPDMGQRAADRAHFAGNTGELRIGQTWRPVTESARDVLVEAHTGEIKRMHETNTTIRDDASISWPPVLMLNSSDTGAEAWHNSQGQSPPPPIGSDKSPINPALKLQWADQYYGLDLPRMGGDGGGKVPDYQRIRFEEDMKDGERVGVIILKKGDFVPARGEKTHVSRTATPREVIVQCDFYLESSYPDHSLIKGKWCGLGRGVGAGGGRMGNGKHPGPETPRGMAIDKSLFDWSRNKTLSLGCSGRMIGVGKLGDRLWHYGYHASRVADGCEPRQDGRLFGKTWVSRKGPRIEAEKWHTFTYRYGGNTPHKRDGFSEVWVDGELCDRADRIGWLWEPEAVPGVHAMWAFMYGGVWSKVAVPKTHRIWFRRGRMWF